MRSQCESDQTAVMLEPRGPTIPGAADLSWLVVSSEPLAKQQNATDCMKAMTKPMNAMPQPLDNSKSCSSHLD
eukprot:m.8277 g.8277  ORF g.8277 m.8277 type:complete len:73 (-) comp2519_c0_seq2:687-905(-)